MSAILLTGAGFSANWGGRLAREVNTASSLQYSDHQIDRGADFHRLAGERGHEGIVSKRIYGRYEPGRRSWLKAKCLNRLLLGYYTPDGRLIYAGRAGTGMSVAELERVWHRLRPLAVGERPLSEPPPRGSRFGSPLVLSRVHWVRPEMVIEVSYVEWTPDKLLRHVVYLGEREDKAAIDMRRDRP
jgi:ATP-dependent DNA ligase